MQKDEIEDRRAAIIPKIVFIVLVLLAVVPEFNFSGIEAWQKDFVVPLCWSSFLFLAGILLGISLIVYGLMQFTELPESFDSLQDPVSTTITRSKGSKAGLIALAGLLIIGYSLHLLATKGCSQIDITIMQLQDSFDSSTGLETPDYRVAVYPNIEPIIDQSGRYYTIDLKDAQKRELILFNIGDYVRKESDPKFLNAIRSVRADVLDSMNIRGVPYEVYVNGSADIVGNLRPFIKELVGEDSRTITFFKKRAPNDDNHWISVTKTEDVPKKYANKHLPNLRAAYIQDRFKDVGLRTTILEGTVTDKESEEDRNALVLLYVQWPARQTPIGVIKMDKEVIKTWGQIAGLGGLALLVFLRLFRDIIRKKIYAVLTKDQTFKLFLVIVIVVSVIALAGILGWVFVETTTRPKNTSMNLEIDSDHSVHWNEREKRKQNVISVHGDSE